MAPLQFGPFGIFRLFGLLFALIAAAIAIKPRELSRRASEPPTATWRASSPTDA